MFNTLNVTRLFRAATIAFFFASIVLDTNAIQDTSFIILIEFIVLTANVAKPTLINR